MGLSDNLKKMMIEYKSAYEEVTRTKKYKNPLSELIRNDIPECIRKEASLNENIYKIKGSCGAGRWTSVPWIAVFDKRITSSAQKGIYIVYLLNKDTQKLYLTLNQGATNIVQNSDGQKGEKPRFSRIAALNHQGASEQLRQNAEEIRKKLNIIEAPYSDMIETGALEYNAGAIYCKEYSLLNLPDDAELVKDLEEFVQYYKKYYEKIYKLKDSELETVDFLDENDEVPDKEKLVQIRKYIENKGFTYNNDLVENFYLSLKSKPFVILAGTSGTGKTRLARLFAEAVGATSKNGRYLQVAVKPDWSDSMDLFGHLDLNNEFVPGAIVEFVKAAQENINYPYFLCLDEMNLARVEYYLSDFLSIIETREKVENGHIITDPLIPKSCYAGNKSAEREFKHLVFPENLYLIGTVNMDETTFPFSRKVLDRANTIEFSYVDLSSVFEKNYIDVEMQKINNEFFKSKYLNIKDCMDKGEYVVQICEQLQAINDVLKSCEMHIGYRVRDEIVFYMLNRREADLLSEDKAFDNEIMQKILPRIQGSGTSVKTMLCRLFTDICAGEYDEMNGLSDSEQMKAFIGEHNCKYQKSAEKIRYMVRRLEEDGFTSYWL